MLCGQNLLTRWDKAGSALLYRRLGLALQLFEVESCSTSLKSFFKTGLHQIGNHFIFKFRL